MIQIKNPRGFLFRRHCVEMLLARLGLRLGGAHQKPDIGLKIEIYAKNLLDDTPITDSFLNSDDSALTTDVFTLDPRLIGFWVSKKF